MSQIEFGFIFITNFTEEFGLQNLLIELAEKKRNEQNKDTKKGIRFNI